LVPRQLELAYVNIMPVDRIPEGDQVFVDHARELSGSRFLPAPESFEWRTSYALPEDSGRLHVLVSTAREIISGAPLRKLDMIARGISNAASSGEMRTWFDLAHEWAIMSKFFHRTPGPGECPGDRARRSCPKRPEAATRPVLSPGDRLYSPSLKRCRHRTE
jgi:hypothetical protein